LPRSPRRACRAGRPRVRRQHADHRVSAGGCGSPAPALRALERRGPHVRRSTAAADLRGRRHDLDQAPHADRARRRDRPRVLPRVPARPEPRRRRGLAARASEKSEPSMSAAARTIADLIQDRFGLPSTAGASLPAEGAVAQLLAHRTHRRYTSAPVPDDVLNVALAAALSAPSKSDLQQVAIVLVNDRAKQATIGGWIPDMPFIATAPRFLVFCGDHRRLRRIFELRGRPFPNDTLDMFMNAAVDAGLVLQAFVTGAEGLGLGCCPISVVRNHVEKLSELLDLPSGVFPVAGMCVGYPSQAGWISMRLPPSVPVHVDPYHDTDLAAQP